MCLKTPKVKTPPPPPPPAPPPAQPADIEFGADKVTQSQGKRKKTRQQLRTALKNPGMNVPTSGTRSGLNINTG